MALPTAAQIIAKYLYGTTAVPQDKVDSSLIRPEFSGQNKLQVNFELRSYGASLLNTLIRIKLTVH